MIAKLPMEASNKHVKVAFESTRNNFNSKKFDKTNVGIRVHLGMKIPNW